MANLKSLNIDGDLILEKETGTRSAVTTTDDIVKIGGNTDFESSGNAKLYQMAVSYHRAKNRVVVVFADDTQAGAAGSPPHAFGIAGKPSADGASIEWGPNHWDGNRGWLFEGPYGGQALSYDRYKECFCWAGTRGTGGGAHVNGIYSSTIQLTSGWNSENRNPSRGAAVMWNVGYSFTQSIGPQGLIYVGDDAGSSAGKHVLLYAHSLNNLRAVVGTVSGSYGNFTVDWNTPLTNYAVFGTTTGGGTNYESGGCKVADNKIAVYWNDGSSEAWCRVGTVASGVITFGTAVRLDVTAVSSGMGPGIVSNCYDIASGKVVFAWWEISEPEGYRIMTRIGTVSGTGITLGTAVTFTGWISSDPHGKVSVVYDENAQRTVIYYKRNDSSSGVNIVKLYGRAATITTGFITNQSALNGEVIFSKTNHGLVANQPIIFTASTGSNLGGNALLPANITAGTTYYVKAGWSGGSSYFILTGVANNFQVSATPGGANIAWGSGFQGVVSSPGHAYYDPNIAFSAEKLVEAPTGSKTFERGSSHQYSYGLCSTYMSHADVKKTVVIRPGGNASNADGGYAKATFTNLNVSTLTVDLSLGNHFELDMDDIILHQGTIGTFTITESLTGEQVQFFTLKVTQGYPARDFNWSTITNVKWPGSTPPVAMSTTNNAVDIYSFTTYDAGTTWHGEVVGQNFT